MKQIPVLEGSEQAGIADGILIVVQYNEDTAMFEELHENGSWKPVN